ncbi:hypothetical protein LB519_11885 [Mesorhizobium sp. AD1-1]|uniref:hypothetical protein n=1 Tax=Mesorhizobium sp. AD1-1 TaxID=2876621 RepID=UPI001CC8F499|nr:hypothetical protein [Mesorhizobium sp. AD1-1]MBZ9718552.1 hypothetical protein [Mesorhizobium sp. AD1-1]
MSYIRRLSETVWDTMGQVFSSLTAGTGVRFPLGVPSFSTNLQDAVDFVSEVAEPRYCGVRETRSAQVAAALKTPSGTNQPGLYFIRLANVNGRETENLNVPATHGEY